jgi:menaquinone-dependent protoporphyrinogen oxidase
MRPALLIAYASSHGSTREVADEIAARLSVVHGFVTYTCAASDVDSLQGYDGVVLGGALYMGRLHAEGRDFLHRFRDELTSLPFAVFAMGPRTLAEGELASARRQLASALAKEPALRPFSTMVFGGVFDPARHRFPLNRLAASDARDWPAIRAWADDIGHRLTALEAAA